jgi:hypothetical protein
MRPENTWKNRTSVNAAQTETRSFNHKGRNEKLKSLTIKDTKVTKVRQQDCSYFVFLRVLCGLKVLLQAFQESHNLPALLLWQS